MTQAPAQVTAHPALESRQRMKDGTELLVRTWLPAPDTGEPRGTVILVHIANLPSFLGRTIYYSPIDGKNLNRVYPGKADGTVSERIAYAITTEVIERADYVVDMHCGDGNEALTRAMKTALRKSDLTVTEDPRQAKFVIQGKVEISAPVNGRQQAKIVWMVNTMDGDEVGKAVQENQVKAGSLNGPWGRIAEIVSNAAVSGIQELFGIESRKSSRRSEPPKFSGSPELPQVPGRAPPPPK